MKRTECSHLDTKIIHTPEMENKYAKLVCVQEDGCQKFLRWMPDPAVQKQRELLKDDMKRIVYLDPCPATPKQRDMMLQWIDLKKLSPKQRMIAERFVERYL